MVVPPPLCCVVSCVVVTAAGVITSSSVQLGPGGGPAATGGNVFVEPADSRMSALERENKVIAIKGLRKEFVTGTFDRSTKVAVNGLDVSFYEGSISILLGHNGAGRVQPRRGSCSGVAVGDRAALLSLCGDRQNHDGVDVNWIVGTDERQVLVSRVVPLCIRFR